MSEQALPISVHIAKIQSVRDAWIIVALASVGCTFDSTGPAIATSTTAAVQTAGSTDSSTTDKPDQTSASGAQEGSSSSAATQGTVGLPAASETGSSANSSSGSTSGSESGSDPSLFSLCDPTDPRLRACYAFTDSFDGPVRDQSAYQNHGTQTNVSTQAGPLGHALGFSTESEVAIPDAPSLDMVLPMSFEVWLWLDSVPAQGRAGVIDRDGQYSLIYYADEGLRCDSWTSAFARNLPLRRWLHIACVHDGERMSMYVNAKLVDSTRGTTQPNLDNPNVMAIGDTSPDFDEPLDGRVGGLRFWSTALTSRQLAEAAATIPP